MRNGQMYRWTIQVPSVFDFCGFYGDGYNASTLASYKNEVAGFVRKDNVKKLINALKEYGKPFSQFRLVTSERYFESTK